MQEIFCHEFDNNKLSFTEIDIYNEYNKSQGISYPMYDNKYFIFKTGDIKITQYGLPCLGDYYKTDFQRCFIKVPLDPQQQNCVYLSDMLDKVFKYVVDNRKKIFGKFDDLIGKFVPLVKKPHSFVLDEDDKKNKKLENKFHKMNHCKFKFNKKFPSGEIKTPIFLNENGQIKKLNITTATELSEYLKFGSTFQAIVKVDKLWMDKHPNDEDGRNVGITLKILQMEITPLVKIPTIDQYYNVYRFQEKNFSDDEIEDDDTISIGI